MLYCRVGYLISLIAESSYTKIHELDKERQAGTRPCGMNPSSHCYCFGPEMACDSGTLLRCGKMKLTMLNCRSTWQSCLLDKAFFSLPINEEKGLLVTRKLCSTLSFLFHCAKLSFPCWLDDYYGQRWRLLPVSGQSMLMLELLFPPPIPGKRKYNLCCILSSTLVEFFCSRITDIG